jgi:SAM-dependent methyltransferase
MLYFEPRYSDAEMGRLYGRYRSEEYCRVRERFEPGYASINGMIGNDRTGIANRKAHIESILRGVIEPPAGNLLDFGGDRGQFIPDSCRSANRFVYEASEADPVDGVVRIDSPEERGPYDLILCCHVLEHLPDPMETVRRIHSLLATGGYAYFEVPVEIGVKTIVSMALGRWIRQGSPGYPQLHEHINFYSRHSLGNAVSLAGLVPRAAVYRTVDHGWCRVPTLSVLARKEHSPVRPRTRGRISQLTELGASPFVRTVLGNLLR